MRHARERALIVPGREALLARLARVQKELAGTKFSFRETSDGVDATCPWGKSHYRARAGREALRPDAARHGLMSNSTRHAGTSQGIARFYREIFGALGPMRKRMNTETMRAWKRGDRQALIFREGDRVNVVNPTHHIMIFVCDFLRPARPARRARAGFRRRATRAQYRCENIVDLDTGPIALRDRPRGAFDEECDVRAGSW